MNDPFASAPTAQAETPAPQEQTFQAPPAEAPAAAPAPAPAAKAPVAVVGSGEGKIVTTLKGGGDFSDPWIVLHADTFEETEEFFSAENGERLIKLMERVQNAAKYFAKMGGGGGNRGGGGGGGQRRSNAPRQAQQPPADAPPAPGPDWVYKSGTSARGPWQAWMPPQHLKDTEKPVWF